MDQSSSLILEDTSSGGTPSIVKSVRIGEHPDKIRVVMDLSEKTDYRIEQSDEGLIVLIDLPYVSWQAPTSEDLKYSMVMQGFRAEPLANGGMRVILTAREAMSVKEHMILPARDGKAPRLVIDLERK